MKVTTTIQSSVSRARTSVARLRNPLVACAVALALQIGSTATAFADGALDRAITLDIKPNTSLEDALITWGTQAGVTVMINTTTVSHRVAPKLSGTLSARKALTLLLQGTGLSFTEDGERVRVVTAAGYKVSALRDIDSDVGTTGIAGGGTPVQTLSDGHSEDTESDYSTTHKDMSEVIVTAEKREERLADVPVSVTAIQADTLLEQNLVRLEDYYNTVPGLTLTSVGSAYLNISLRGLNTGNFTNPTVGVVVDDVPFGGTTGLGNRAPVPDLDPSDLARIEVLRGPQGTLYGAASMGGLLKYVTVDPSTDGVSGRIQGDVNSVHNGNAPGYGLRAAVNLPLGDTLAVRISGFGRSDPGYVNDYALGLRGINREVSDGGHFAALWKPSVGWSLKLSALFQNLVADGIGSVNLQPNVGDLQQIEILRNVGGYSRNTKSFTATLNGDLGGGVHLTSVTGYGIERFEHTADLSSSVFGRLSALLYGPSNNGAEQIQFNQTKKFTEEIRLSGTILSRVDWLLGGFYTRENTPTHDVIDVINPTTLVVPGLFYDDPYPTTYKEYAGFADLTYHFTDTIDLQLGGRESHNEQTYHETVSGPGSPLVGYPDPTIQPLVRTKDDSFTYLATPRWKITPDAMLYARFASGYRPGGPNLTCVAFPTPCQYQPDKTKNYEIGTKDDFLDHRLSVDASVYYITWTNIQLQVFTPDFNEYFLNASRAKSQGIELSVEARPIATLNIAAWATVGDATLTSDFPAGAAAYGKSGDRLPYSSRYSGGFSLDQQWRVSGELIASVGSTVSYMGNRENEFASSATRPRVLLPGYATVNLHGGVRHGPWSLGLYVNNVMDRRGILAIAEATPTIYGGTLQQPRTVGMTLSRTF